ncbi:hypothetical protein GmHk_11G032781 [Glycine max]|nr:hypothetical protein GmHk_11G032781 [Glycine max]
MEALFRKLFAYEHELFQQSHAEETKKKRKGIALKVNSSKEDYKESSSDDEDAENLSLTVKKFGKSLKRSKDRKFSKPSKKIESNNNTLGSKKSSYIAWEDNDASTSSNSSSEKDVANICLMADSMDDSSTIEETEVNSKFEEVLKAFNEMHDEALRLVVYNNKLRSDLKLHITKLALTQSELDKLRQENEKRVSSYEATGCVYASTALNMNNYKSLQIEFEKFKKNHYEERMKLQTELSYIKDMFRKLNKGESDLRHLLSVQKHTIDKTVFRYNKQITFSKKTKFSSFKKWGVGIMCIVYCTFSVFVLDNGHINYYFRPFGTMSLILNNSHLSIN